MVEFRPGRLSSDVYRQRCSATTAEQLAALTTDPAFAAWQLRKAARDNRARVVSNALAVASCLLLVVTLALLKPAAVAQAPRSPTPAAALAATPVPQPTIAEQAADYHLQLSRQETEAALDTISDLSLQLREAQEARDSAIARLIALDASEELEQSLGGEHQHEAAELIANMAAQLEAMKGEVAAAEAAADAAAALADAAVAASEALAYGPLPSGVQQSMPANPLFMKTVLSSASSVAAFSNASTAHMLAAATANTQAPAPSPAATYALMAAAACGLLAALGYLRNRASMAAETQRAAQLVARLKETSFAKDTAEQSLALLEAELQRRMKQLDEVQQRAIDAASPRISAMPAQHTPGKGELPPPPASLVEKFLQDHNFLAVQQEQMQEWLEMEQRYSEMESTLSELQATLADKEAQIASLEQDFNAIHEHSSLEVRALEEQLSQVRSWLDEAQEELLNTQAALQEREAECRRVSMQLEAMRALSGQVEASQAADGREELLQQNLELVRQLQQVTAKYEEMQAQLAASSACSTTLATASFGLGSHRPAPATSTVPGTPTADLTSEVQSCLEIMRATRAQLADRLAHSAGVCEAMIADCQVAHRKGEPISASKAAHKAEGDGSIAATNDQVPEAFGSPAAPSPSGCGGAGETECMVLGVSKRHHVNLPLQRSPSPTKPTQKRCTNVSPTESVDGSMRQAWEAARVRVAEVRAQHTAWDLAGFVRSLGFEIEDEGMPVERSDFLALKVSAEAALHAAAADAATPEERALAGEAMQVVSGWEWPVHRIHTPPPSPFWRMLGLQA